MTSSVWHWTSSQKCLRNWEMRKTMICLLGPKWASRVLSTRSKEWVDVETKAVRWALHLEAWITAHDIEAYPSHKQHWLHPGHPAPQPTTSAHRAGEDARDGDEPDWARVSQQQPLPLGTSPFTRECHWGWAASLEGHHLAETIAESRQGNQSRENQQTKASKIPWPLLDLLEHQGTQWARIRPETEGLPVQEQAPRGGLGVVRAMVAFTVDPPAPLLEWCQLDSHTQSCPAVPTALEAPVIRGSVAWPTLSACAWKKENTGSDFFSKNLIKGHKEVNMPCWEMFFWFFP